MPKDTNCDHYVELQIIINFVAKVLDKRSDKSQPTEKYAEQLCENNNPDFTREIVEAMNTGPNMITIDQRINSLKGKLFSKPNVETIKNDLKCPVNGVKTFMKFYRTNNFIEVVSRVDELFSMIFTGAGINPTDFSFAEFAASQFDNIIELLNLKLEEFPPRETCS